MNSKRLDLFPEDYIIYGLQLKGVPNSLFYIGRTKFFKNRMCHHRLSWRYLTCKVHHYIAELRESAIEFEPVILCKIKVVDETEFQIERMLIQEFSKSFDLKNVAGIKKPAKRMNDGSFHE